MYDIQYVHLELRLASFLVSLFFLPQFAITFDGLHFCLAWIIFCFYSACLLFISVSSSFGGFRQESTYTCIYLKAFDRCN